MKNITHALLIDEDCQWLAYIVKFDQIKLMEINQVEEYLELPSQMDKENPFISNIYNRDINHYRITLQPSINGINGFYGWSLSELDYNRIKRMITLWPSLQEYKNIVKYP